MQLTRTNFPTKHFRSELKYFSRMTTKVKDPSKKNAVIMGRKTYFGVPESKRPLPGRVNIILSTTLSREDLPGDVILCKDLKGAVERIQQPDLRDIIENIWIVGGSGVYKEAMESPNCHRVYFTEIKAKFDCDTFFPDIPKTFKLVEPDHDVPADVQEENGIKYQYRIYEKSR